MFECCVGFWGFGFWVLGCAYGFSGFLIFVVLCVESVDSGAGLWVSVWWFSGGCADA